ncbi:MAG: sulfotransferase domain-containing protein, partial [Bacteroidota bacterium]
FSFADALAGRARKTQNGFDRKANYLQGSMYGCALKNYLEHHKRSNLLILDYAEFKRDNTSTFDQIARFLGIPSFEFDFQSYRPARSGRPKSRLLNRVSTQMRLPRPIGRLISGKLKSKIKRNINRYNLEREVLSSEIRKELIAEIRPDIQAFIRLSGLQLDPWLE